MVEILESYEQAWLQGMMSHRIVTEERAKEMFKVAIQSMRLGYEEQLYNRCYTKVNKAINVVSLEIRRTIDERNGNHLLAIVNTKSDEIAQISTQFSSNEIEFVKRLIGEIFSAPRHAYCISSTIALGLGREMDPELSSSKADIICKKLNAQGWLVKESGFYFLAPRALLELQSYLRGLYEEYMHPCLVCKDIVTRGQACSTSKCDVFVHTHCHLRHDSLLRQADGVKSCTKCKQVWSPVEVGETTNASTMVRRRRRNRDGPNPLGFESVQNGEDEDEEESEDDEANEAESESNTQSTAPKRRHTESSSRQERTSRRRKVKSENNEDEEDQTAPLEEDEEEEDDDE